MTSSITIAPFLTNTMPWIFWLCQNEYNDILFFCFSDWKTHIIHTFVLYYTLLFKMVMSWVFHFFAVVNIYSMILSVLFQLLENHIVTYFFLYPINHSDAMGFFIIVGKTTYAIDFFCTPYSVPLWRHGISRVLCCYIDSRCHGYVWRHWLLRGAARAQ